ncbi:MAG: hypothetical protein KOO61_01365, partial [Spirochaetales bacterium]|nr:hypothetical protein [Spirochaetales bacterium]
LILQDHEFRQQSGSEPARRVESLGAYLTRCASVPPAHFTNYLSNLLHEQVEAEYRALTALLDHHHGRPKWWAREIQRRLAIIDRHTRENTVDVSDVTGSDRFTRVGHLQRATRLYGEFLQMWPAIYRVARELRESGRQPSRPLFRENSA